MGARGPKPRPTPLKILAGTRRDRVNTREPTQILQDPVCPAHLGPIAQAEFGRLVDLLRSTGVLSQTDGDALAIYAQTYARWVEAEQAIETFGLVVETVLGGVKSNPALAIARDAKSLMARLLAEFGCTPASRSRVKTASDEQPKDKLGEFLARKKAR